MLAVLAIVGAMLAPGGLVALSPALHAVTVGGAGAPGRSAGSGIFPVHAMGTPHAAGVALSAHVATGPVTGWWNITSESPTLLPNFWFTEGTWDATDGYMMFYGGDNWAGTNLADTWAYSAGAWSLLPTQGSPGPLDGPALAYDPLEHRVIMFGGLASYSPFSYTNLTWFYSGGSWTSAHLNPSPAARLAGSMVYDPDLGGVVLFGGYNNSDPSGSTLLNDLWLYKLGNWSRIAATNPPPVRTWASLAYDSTHHDIVLYSGLNGLSQCIGDTWTFTGGSWTHVAVPSGGPTGLCAPAVGYDTDLGRIVLTGGMTSAQVASTGTWWFNGTAWLAQGASGQPNFHVYGVSAWDPVEHSFVVAGGWNQYSTTDVLSLPLTVTNITGPASAEAGELVNFQAAAVGGEPARTLAWSWGDGTTSSGNPGSHSYGAPGSYTISVNVTDGAGSSAAGASAIRVVVGPIASIAATPAREDVGVGIAFSGSSSGGSGGPSFAWTFGDGGHSAAASAVHAYSAPGTYTASLQVRDTAGGTGTASRTIAVLAAPSVHFGPPGPAEVGWSTAWNATVAGGIAPLSYSWSFDDGATATGPTVDHTFTTSGSHTVHLSVQDAANVTATGQVVLAVAPGLSVNINGPQSAAPGFVGTWSATVTGGKSPYVIKWTLPDGSSASSTSASFTFSKTGTFPLHVEVTDALGATASSAQNVAVTSSSSTPGGLATSAMGTELIIVAAVVIAAAAAAGLLYRRRAQRPPPSE